MTNEEKSREIASKYSSDVLQTGAYYGAKDMAEHKDKEFKDCINKWIDYFSRGCERGFVSQNSFNDMRYFASKIVDDLF